MIKIAHIVKTLAGTSIPVEIASYLNRLPGVQSHIISLTRSDEIPDIVEPGHIVLNGVERVERAVDFIRDGGYSLANTHHNAGSAESRRIVWKLRREGIPVVDSQHGRIHYSRRHVYSNAVGMLLSGGVTFNSFCTEQSYTWVERALISRKPQKVIHLGVNTALIERYRKGFSGAIKRVSCAARLIPRKNHKTLLTALAHIKRTGVALDLIGGGPLQDSLKAEAERLGIADQVTFHGALRDRERVYEVLAASDLFVLPSLGEGFCVAVAEAMALGLPVITSDIDTFREVVGDKGVYVPATDSRSLANEITALIDAPERARELGRANQDRALTLFAMDRTVQQFKEFYEYVLAR